MQILSAWAHIEEMWYFIYMCIYKKPGVKEWIEKNQALDQSNEYGNDTHFYTSTLFFVAVCFLNVQQRLKQK